MEFVSAASNLRSRVFNIPLQSLYDAKGVAGNIIPAIASTNAIVASLQVNQHIYIDPFLILLILSFLVGPPSSETC